jgi:hypothetical protein
MATEINFRGWQRAAIGALVTGVEGGRARGQVTVTLAGTDGAGAATGTRSGQLAFLLAGPGDVTGLTPGAVSRRFPAPGSGDAETTKCPYLELADAALPWRYTPAATPAGGARRLRPWLILVVGTPEEVAIEEDQATLAPAVLAAHPPADSFRWAHAQDATAAAPLARLLSPRPLPASTDLVAALVPGFAVTEAGALADAWAPTATAPVTLPVYDHWGFRTGPGGDFRTLATRLKPGAAAPSTGRAPLAYPRVQGAAPLGVRGALAPVGSAGTEPPLPSAIAADLAGLRTPPADQAGRPVVGLPRHGEPWVADPDTTTWGAAANADPRGRVVAGLGARLAVALQDELSTEAERQAGALGVAANRLRDLSAGLAAAGTLWQRRLPADPARALWLVGPALRRVATDRGTAVALLTAPDRPQPPGWTSTAAWRVLRRGPARTALAEPDASDPARLQDAANRCPPRSPFRETGLPPFDLLGAGDFEVRRRDIAGGAPADPQGPRDALAALDLSRWPRFKDLLDALRRRVDDAVGAGRPLPRVRIAVLLGLLGRGEDDPRFDRERVEEELPRLVDGFEQAADDPQVVRDLLDGLGEEPEEPPPCRPHDLGAVAAEVVGVFDPTRPDAPAVRAVLEAVIGLDPAQPLTPPEPCPGLDFPMWRHLAQLEPDWLLPGVGQLPEDSVIAAETNAAFADAFLAGCNTRLVGELRWRNIRIAAGCTPLRAFWSRSDPTSGARVTDIVGIQAWAATSGLGAAQHRPVGIGGQDLVLVFRTRLLERYPGTVLWLVSAEHNGQVDFTQGPDPAAPKRLPTFQGNLGPGVSYFGFQGLPSGDIVRMWLVLEEAPGGYGFRNDEPTADAAADGAAFADIAFDDPVRVLYRGDRLTTGGP